MTALVYWWHIVQVKQRSGLKNNFRGKTISNHLNHTWKTDCQLRTSFCSRLPEAVRLSSETAFTPSILFLHAFARHLLLPAAREQQGPRQPVLPLYCLAELSSLAGFLGKMETGYEGALSASSSTGWQSISLSLIIHLADGKQEGARNAGKCRYSRGVWTQLLLFGSHFLRAQTANTEDWNCFVLSFQRWFCSPFCGDELWSNENGDTLFHIHIIIFKD